MKIRVKPRLVIRMTDFLENNEENTEQCDTENCKTENSKTENCNLGLRL
jgi:hypothetical protein